MGKQIIVHKDGTRIVLVQSLPCALACAEILLSLCGPCAWVLVHFPCAWSLPRSVAPEISECRRLSQSPCACPCAVLVHSLCTPRALTGPVWDLERPLCDPCALPLCAEELRILVRSLIQICTRFFLVHFFLVQPCAILVRNCFRWNFLSIQYCIYIYTY